MTTLDAFTCYMDKVHAAWKKNERPPNFPAKLLDQVDKLIQDWNEERGRRAMLEGIEDK